MKTKKVVLVLAIVTFVFSFFYFGLDDFFSFAYLKQNQASLNAYVNENYLFSIFSFAGAYVLITALSLPGAAVMTIASGAFFGFGPGLILASIASSAGATLAFFSSRLIFRDLIENRFANALASINRGMEKDDIFYLFSLRLIPIFPFFLVNLAMGLTPISARTFFFVSQLGMLPGTMAYVNAGTQLSKIESVRGVLSPEVIVSFAILGMFPLLSRFAIQKWRKRKHSARYKRPKRFDYNMVVIGAGSAGLVSAYIGAALKARVALVEKHRMGGDCLNTGCVPSKALIRSAKMARAVKDAEEFGILGAGAAKVDFAKVMGRVRSVIQKIEPHDSVDRYSALGVECISGEARIVSPYEVRVGERSLKTKNIVIATGASPFVPDLPGLQAVNYFTSDTIWDLKNLPRRLLVLGGGAIGCELAQSFARLGSEVVIVESSAGILSREDGDVSAVVAKSLATDGVKILAGHRAIRFANGGRKLLVCEAGGKEVEVEFDEVLIALGRRANVRGFGLEDLGVELSPRGTVCADPYLRTTNFENIYVCGDVTGPYQFTHTASHQAWYVAVNALFSPFKKYKVDYRVIPWCTFSEPEVARVGLNEKEAREKEVPHEVTLFEFKELDRAIAEGDIGGFVKVLTRPGSDQILGATIVGAHAGELITEYVSAMKHRIGLNKILGTIHVYPTFAEANKYAAGVWRRSNSPQRVLSVLQKFHAWRRG